MKTSKEHGNVPALKCVPPVARQKILALDITDASLACPSRLDLMY